MWLTNNKKNSAYRVREGAHALIRQCPLFRYPLFTNWNWVNWIKAMFLTFCWYKEQARTGVKGREGLRGYQFPVALSNQCSLEVIWTTFTSPSSPVTTTTCKQIKQKQIQWGLKIQTTRTEHAIWLLSVLKLQFEPFLQFLNGPDWK